MPQQVLEIDGYLVRSVEVIYRDLGSPDAIVVETTEGCLYVVADPWVPIEKLRAVVDGARYLPEAGRVPFEVLPT